MTTTVVGRCRATLDRSANRRDVFLKVGSSDTVSSNFLQCYDGRDVELDAFTGLEATRTWFRQTRADGTATSFSRRSLAAGVGWTAGRMVTGDPSPIVQEITAIRPGFGLVMAGTQDTAPDGLHTFERNLRRLVDTLVAAGVVPALSTIPPRNDQAAADAVVPEMNAVIRALAQARQVPYVDLWQVVVPLPNRGLTGDGVHLNVHTVRGQARGCRLTTDGLAFGMNQRNRVTLETLDRLRRFVVLDGEAPEPEPPPLAGHGTWDDPRLVDRLPFVDDGDTRTGVSVADRYGPFAQDESGPEVVYRIDLPVATRIRARVFGDDGVDVDLHWMDAPDPARATARADRTLDVVATPGTYYLAADTFVSLGQPKAGPYRLTIVAVP